MSGRLWAAQLAVDWHLFDLLPESLLSMGESRPITFLALAATIAALFFWLKGPPRSRRR